MLIAKSADHRRSGALPCFPKLSSPARRRCNEPVKIADPASPVVRVLQIDMDGGLLPGHNGNVVTWQGGIQDTDKDLGRIQSNRKAVRQYLDPSGLRQSI